MKYSEILTKLYEKVKNNPTQDIDEIMIAETESEEEKDVLIHMLDSVDIYQQKLNSFRGSVLNPEDWLDKEADNLTKELIENPLEEDYESVRKGVIDGIDANISQMTVMLQNEYLEEKEETKEE